MIYFRRIKNKEELTDTDFDFIEALIKEVDPYWVLDLSGVDYVFQNHEFWYLKVYSDAKCIKQIGFVAFTVTKDLFAVYKRGYLYHMYLLPEYRGISGGRVIKEVERIARNDGAVDFEWSAHVGSAMDKCFRGKHGYIKTESRYLKIFKKV